MLPQQTTAVPEWMTEVRKACNTCCIREKVRLGNFNKTADVDRHLSMAEASMVVMSVLIVTLSNLKVSSYIFLLCRVLIVFSFA